MRSGHSERKSQETSVSVAIDLDGTGQRDITTELPMLDHLLSQFAFHSK